MEPHKLSQLLSNLVTEGFELPYRPNINDFMPEDRQYPVDGPEFEQWRQAVADCDRQNHEALQRALAAFDV